MARRARARRETIPGYDAFRPSRAERVRDHRRARHAANQMLRTVADIEDLTPLPQVRPDHHHDVVDSVPAEPERRRFDVGKTKFWKRRDQYRDYRSRLDSMWPDIGPVEG